jgi:hypothetical protein
MAERGEGEVGCWGAVKVLPPETRGLGELRSARDIVIFLNKAKYFFYNIAYSPGITLLKNLGPTKHHACFRFIFYPSNYIVFR